MSRKSSSFHFAAKFNIPMSAPGTNAAPPRALATGPTALSRSTLTLTPRYLREPMARSPGETPILVPTPAAGTSSTSTPKTPTSDWSTPTSAPTPNTALLRLSHKIQVPENYGTWETPFRRETISATWETAAALPALRSSSRSALEFPAAPWRPTRRQTDPTVIPTPHRAPSPTSGSIPGTPFNSPKSLKFIREHSRFGLRTEDKDRE